MRKSMFFVVLFCGILLAENSECEKRRSLCQTWVNYAKKVVEKVNLKDASGAHDFLRKRYIAVVPTMENGNMIMNNCEKEAVRNYIRLVAVTEDDPERWQYRDRDLTAFSQAEDRVILVREFSKEPDLIRGIVLLHEAVHAVRAQQRNYKKATKKEIFYEEVEVHILQNQMFEKVGGNFYLGTVSSMRQEIEEIMEKNGGVSAESLGEIEEKSKKYADSLNKVFGPVLSEGDEICRITQLVVHAFFNWIDEKYFSPAERKDKKAFFLFIVTGSPKS
jgi:hypothetical protein